MEYCEDEGATVMGLREAIRIGDMTRDFKDLSIGACSSDIAEVNCWSMMKARPLR